MASPARASTPARTRQALVTAMLVLLVVSGCTDGPAAEQSRGTRGAAPTSGTRSVVFDTRAVTTTAAGQPGDRVRVTSLSVDGATVIAPLERINAAWQLRRSTDAGRSWSDATVDGGVVLDGPVDRLAHRPGQWLLVRHDPGDAPSTHRVAVSRDGAAFTTVPARLRIEPTETLRAVVGTRSGWVALTTTPETPLVDVLRTRRSLDGRGWDEAVAAVIPGDPFVLEDIASSDTTVAMGGVTVIDHPVDTQFRAAVVTSTDGGRTFRAAPSPNADDDHGRVDGVQYVGDTLQVDLEALHPASTRPDTDWATATPGGWRTETVAGIRPPASRTDDIDVRELEYEARAMSVSGPSRVLAMRIGVGSGRHYTVFASSAMGRPFVPVVLPAQPVGTERFVQDADPVPDGHLVTWSDYTAGHVVSHISHIDATGRVTDRSPRVAESSPSRPVVVESTVADDGTLLGRVGRQSVLFRGWSGSTVSRSAALTLPDGYVAETVVGSSHGYLAQGWKQGSVSSAPGLFTSREGRTWSAVDRSLLNDARVRTTFWSDRGWVAAGTTTVDGATSGTLAVSADGVRWVRLRPRALAGTLPRAVQISAGMQGPARTLLLAGSQVGVNGPMPRVFLGDANGDWRTISLNLPAGSVSGEVDRVVGGGARRLAVGNCPTSSTAVACTWRSSDRGATWSTGSPVNAPDGGAVIATLPVDPGGTPGLVIVSQKDGTRRVGVLAQKATGWRSLAVDTAPLTGAHTDLTAAAFHRGSLLLSGTAGPDRRNTPLTIAVTVDASEFEPGGGNVAPTADGATSR